METINIIVVGARATGKRTFFRSIREKPVMSTGPQFFPPADPDVNEMQFGSICIDDMLVYVFGFNLYLLSLVPGTEFLDDLRETQGYIVLVNSTDERSFFEGRALLRYMAHFPRVPYVVVANKQDCEDAMTVGQIRRAMELPDETIILPCVATERASVVNVLNTLLTMIRPDLKDLIS